MAMTLGLLAGDPLAAAGQGALGKADAGTALASARATAEPMARAIALALGEREVRRNLRDALRDSAHHEHKLVLQDFVRTAAGRQWAAAVARAGEQSPGQLRARLRALPALDLYFPFREHRTTWKATSELLVAAVFVEDQPEIVAYDVNGGVHTLRLADGVPASPLLLLQAAEPKRPRQDLATARRELVEDPDAPRLEAAPAASGQGWYLYHYNIQVGDGWLGDSEIQFRTFYEDLYPHPRYQWAILYRDNVVEDRGYNVNLFLNGPPGPEVPNPFTGMFGMELWELDGGLNGGDDYYGFSQWQLYTPGYITEFYIGVRTAWVGVRFVY